MTNERKRKRGLGRALAAQVGGYTSYGPTRKATLYVGRVAGLDYGGIKEGTKIPPREVGKAVMGLRSLQIGPEAAGTVTVTTGYYKGQREPSTKVEIAYTGAEPVAKFRPHVKRLAQEAASMLAQREIIVEWVEPGRRPTTDTATPVEAPPAFNQKLGTDRFCAWVRKFSPSARTNPRDPCARKRRGSR